MTPSHDVDVKIIRPHYASNTEMQILQMEENNVTDRNNESGIADRQEVSNYVVGWRLHLISSGLLLALYMSQMESSIISTSVIAITDDLGGYGKSSWIFIAYLLTYSGMLIIWAKMSDIFGRKPLLIIALLVFIVFSGACGGSQSFIQLVMFRWVLGLGGCGIYSIATLLFFELVPPPKYADYTALVTGVIALALISGPLLGGAIVSHSNWRWVFLINVPIGSVSLLLLMITMPQRLHTEPAASRTGTPFWHSFALRILKKVDILGALLLLGACLLVSTALQQATAGISFAERSVLPLLVLSGLMWTGFVVWQWYATTKLVFPEPVLPSRLFASRVFLGMMLNTYFAGTILTVCIVQIPQRFMNVNGKSAFQAGARLLPFGAFIPAGSTLAATLMGRARIPPVYLLLAGGSLEIVGTTCLSTVSIEYHIRAVQYGYQILIGTGIGFSNAALILLVPVVAERKDLAVGAAAIAQFRLMGGLIGLAIVTTLFNRYTWPQLLQILQYDQAKALLESRKFLGSLSEARQLAVRSILGEGYNLQMRVLIGFAAAQLPATLLMWKRKPLVVSH